MRAISAIEVERCTPLINSRLPRPAASNSLASVMRDAPPRAYWLAKRAQSVKSVEPSTFMRGMKVG